MDPVTIISFVGASAKIAVDLGTTLYQFAQAARDVDQTFKGLAAEASGVSQSLSALERTLRSSTVRSLHQSGHRSQDQLLWQSVKGSVADCRKTLSILQRNLAESRPLGSTLIQQWISQFKLRLKTDDIVSLRGQLQTHRASLHTSLLMMDVYATSLTSGLVLDELIPRVSELQESMKNLTLQQNSVKTSSEDAVPSVPFLEDQANRVINSALTIAEERSLKSNTSDIMSTTGSELDEAIEPATTRRVETWASNTPTLIRNNMLPNTVGSPQFVAARGSLASFQQYPSMRGEIAGGFGDEDEDDDFMLDHVRQYLREGDIRHQTKELLDAEDWFQGALQKAQTLTPQQQSRLDLDNAHFMLGVISYEMKDYDKAEQRLLPIADSSANLRSLTGYMDAQRRYDACHTLARIYLSRENVADAESYCMKALQGRYKMKATAPTLYYPSAKLMSEIATAKGDLKEAKMFSGMVPPDAQQIRVPSHLQMESASLHSLSGDSVIILPSHPFSQPPQSPQSEDSSPRLQKSDAETFNVSSRSSTATAATQAPTSDDPLTLSVLIQNNFDPNYKSFDPDHVLFWAAKSGEEHIVSQMLSGFRMQPCGQKKAKPRVIKATNIDKISNEGLTPLMVASSRGHIGTVKVLLQGNAKVNVRTKAEKKTALHIAALRGNVDIIQPLIDAGVEVDAADNLGNTALHWACIRGETDMVVALLSAGANREAKTLSGCTSLHLAVLSRQEEVVSTLLHHGVKVNAALFTTATSPHATPSSVTAFTSETDAGPPIPPLQQPAALHLSATNGDTRILSLLLLPAFHADIEICTTDGRTPLHAAVLAGQLSAVILLLEQGANIEARDVHGRSALSFAAGMGATLETAPNPPSRQSSTTKTPSPILSPLDSLQPYSQETTPAHITLLHHLLRSSANPLNRESDGCTPLHVASFEGDITAVRLLLRHGADPTLERAGGLTARDLAKKMGFKEVEKVLREAERRKDRDGGNNNKEAGGGRRRQRDKDGGDVKTKILGLGPGRKLTA